MIRSQTTSVVVKTLLINLVIRNLGNYAAILDELAAYIKSYIVDDYLNQVEREDRSSKFDSITFLTEHLED